MSVALVSGQAGQTTSQSKTVTPEAKPAAPDVSAQRAIIDQYCVTCHNSKAKVANLQLDQLDLAHLSDHAEIGEKIIRKLRAGMMPPLNMKRPDPATVE